MLESLEPKEVFRYFEEICAIPHGSGDLAKIGDYCEAFAKAHNLWCMRDGFGNVIIKKDGDERAPVILQGHLDMVCVKTPDCTHDFKNDPLPIRTDGETIYTNGTTLGADDGIAVAMILAILADDTLKTPPIEAVLTADEEVGMSGAMGLDASVLRGRRMLNLDTETEGSFCVSCAGGERVRITRDVQTEPCNAPCYKAALSGLQGGHSGTEIDKGHLNAIRCMVHLLIAVADVRLVSLTGGKVDNAIPSACTAVFSGNAQALRNIFETLRPHWSKAEPDITLTVEETEPAEICLDRASTDAALAVISQFPDGVDEMSEEVPGMVQTSLNTGRCTVDADGVRMVISTRSNADEDRKDLVRGLVKRCEKHSADAETSGGYPAWQYRKDSPLREAAARVFEKQYGHAPKIEGIHAGLECGIFSSKLEDFDCISIGPDIYDIHTPSERMPVRSVARTYALVREILQTLK